VLVTSRATGWTNHNVPISVEPLPSSPAVHLLVSLSGDSDCRAAAQLAELVGHLPLALAQAGAFCGATALPLSEYLRLYQAQRTRLHSTGTAPGYNATIATTWRLSVDRLSANARTLLTLLSFFAPDAIPVYPLLAPPDPQNVPLPAELEPVLRPLLVDQLTRHTAMGELLAYSLATRATSAGSVSVHRLVQAVIHDQLADQQPWITAAKTLVEQAWPAYPANAVSIAQWLTLHPHVRAVIEHLPPQHLDTLVVHRNVAHWTGEAGTPRRHGTCSPTWSRCSNGFWGPRIA
jgi:hypothetical protein